MATLEQIIEGLSAPFPPDWIEFRVGNTDAKKQADGKPKRGQALAYIDARTVMDRLDEVVGPFNWQGEHIACGDGKKVTCRVGIRNPETGEWVWKSDGAGETDYEGEKGSYSDSLKRAAVHWGIGRYLYDLASPWVNVEVFGKSVTIPDEEKRRLRNSLPRPGKPPAAAGNGHSANGSKPPPPKDADDVTTAREHYKGITAAIKAAPHEDALDSLLDVSTEKLAFIEKHAGAEAKRRLLGVADWKRADLRGEHADTNAMMG